jgi:hypothetical protein
LEHHSIGVTVGVYWHLIQSANRAEVNELDDSGAWNLQPGATGTNSGLRIPGKQGETANLRKQSDFE